MLLTGHRMRKSQTFFQSCYPVCFRFYGKQEEMGDIYEFFENVNVGIMGDRCARRRRRKTMSCFKGELARRRMRCSISSRLLLSFGRPEMTLPTVTNVEVKLCSSEASNVFPFFIYYSIIFMVKLNIYLETAPIPN